MKKTVFTVLTAFLIATALTAEPRVVNPGFEADRYEVYPGYASRNGGVISGWEYSGNVGINPFWNDPGKPAGPEQPFADNAIIPEGRQAALMQNRCELKQQVGGFEKGKQYRLSYRENGRALNMGKETARIEVILDGEVIVSNHEVAPIEAANRYSLPWYLVESAIFKAPRDGDLELLFRTTIGAGVTILIDDVRIEEVADGADSSGSHGKKAE